MPFLPFSVPTDRQPPEGGELRWRPVERKEGRLSSAAGRVLRLLDLPGVYSLHPRTPDEAVTVDVLRGPPHDTPTTRLKRWGR